MAGYWRSCSQGQSGAELKHISIGIHGFLDYFSDFRGIFRIFGQILGFWVKITCFLSFSNRNDAESSINFIKIQFLDPKRAKLVQKSYRKFRESLRNLPRPVQEDP